MDDTVDLIEEMPSNVVKRILKTVNKTDRETINELLKYPSDSAGSIMTTEFIDLKVNMTVDKAFEKMEQGSMMAIIDIIYAGLIHEDANLTKHQVSHMIDIANMNEIVEQITKAMGNDVNGDTVNPN
jgi:hypothetical protein